MKKKICLFLMLFVISLILTACVPDNPYNYSDTTWVCEEPYMCFEVHRGDYPLKGEVKTEDGEVIQIEVDFPPAWMEIYTGEGNSYSCIYTGSITMKKHGKVMKVETLNDNNYEYDQLYHGKYKKLTFERQD